MKYRARAAILVGLLSLSGCGLGQPSRSPDASQTTAETPRRAIQKVLDDWTAQGPGGVTMASAEQGGDVTLFASGVAEPDGRPMATDDEIRVGSITKVVVAVMVLQLVDAGELRLDEPVTRYLPDVQHADGVSVRQLLDHTSGIPNYIDESLFLQMRADMDRAWTPQEVLELVADRPRDFAPGEKRAYSNTNYVIAGLLLEAVTGSSLSDNLRARISEPLGLANTYFAPEVGREPIAGFSPFFPGGDTTSASYRAVETAAGATGALVANAPDLATFLSALTGGQLLSQDMLTAMTDDRGLGFERFQLPSGAEVPAKRGSIAGFDCLMWIGPAPGQMVAILTNDGTRSVADLAAELFS